MKKNISLCFLLAISAFTVILLNGCSANYRDMSDDEFWNESHGRFKGKTDSTYYYQVEMYETKADYAGINILDEPVITSNFTKILKINDDASADTSYFYTVRITQKKKGLERITKPLKEQLDLLVNGKHVIELNIDKAEVRYIPRLYSAEYGYKNGYYYCDVMCPIDYKAFVYLANAETIEGTISVNTTLLGEDKSLDGSIMFTSTERHGDAQIINRFFNTNPTR
ncbi:MAG: hypothetical protein HY959_11860 [Ignavibacteriae bacterium]|nr:hypothetical protein [Ignavibacteriota bacterium]